jgi:hypothetical protein
MKPASSIADSAKTQAISPRVSPPSMRRPRRREDSVFAVLVKNIDIPLHPLMATHHEWKAITHPGIVRPKLAD